MPLTRRLLTGVALAVALPVAASPAAADPHSGIDTQLYRQSFDPLGVLSLEGGETMEKHDFSMKFGVGYHQSPFDVAVPGIGGVADTGADSVLKFAVSLHMTLALAITDRLQIGLDAGAYRTDPDEGYGERGLYRDSGPEPSSGLISLRPHSNIDPSGGFEDQGLAGPLDARLNIKFRVLTGKLSASVLATATLPFGDEEMFLGDSNFVFEPRFAIEYKLDPLEKTKFVGNVGLRIRERTVLEAYDSNVTSGQDEVDAQAVLDIGSEAFVGAGAVFEALPQLLVSAEAMFFLPLPEQLSYGDCRLNIGMRCSALDDPMVIGDMMTMEDDRYFDDAGYGDFAGYVMAGVSYRATPDTTLTVSGGAGVLGARRDDFRIVSGITWAPRPAGVSTIGRGDRDRDGIPDSSDICPDEPEDKDDYQDEDGCPELDNDGDGIIDENDACPNEPEDKDAHEDDDGCPERDNDGDNIPDVTDRCPDQAEDVDGFEDDDGCADDDNDGDGFEDSKDKCPNEAETVNGIDDQDGCPDSRNNTGPQETPRAIDLRGNRITWQGNTARLTKGSERLLDQVAGVINNMSRPVPIRVEVHVPLSTQSRNRRVIQRAQNRDKRLANARAQAIVNYLGPKVNIQLQAAGIGSERPLSAAPPQDPLQDRVDFVKVVQP